jgi:formylglycine-generating enzyme required for sulfatase activity/class 3 adenylate cyclase
MVQQKRQRRLATILAADIVDFSTMMSKDEPATTALITKHHEEIIDPAIRAHDGRLAKDTGNGFLAEFESPVEAVRCAVDIQQSMTARNLDISLRTVHRIGINLGEIIAGPDDISGVGADVAMRLQEFAGPGGICISSPVYELVKNKVDARYQSLGDKQIQNVAQPVRAYRVVPDFVETVKAVQPESRVVRRSTAALISIGVGLIIAAGAGGFVWIRLANEQPDRQAAASKSVAAATDNVTVALPPPAPPSVAVPPPPPAVAAPPPPPPAAVPAPPRTVVLERKPLAEEPPPAPKPAHVDMPVYVPPTPPPDRAAVVQPPLAAPAKTAVTDPEMVSLRGGEFKMGSDDDPSERPIHVVTIKPFSIGKFPVTVSEWKQCVAAKACADLGSSDVGPGDDKMPMANLSWRDAKQYVAWLSDATKHTYRLPTEAEWEYAARGGTQTKFWWGNAFIENMADCDGCEKAYNPYRPTMIGSFKPNPFGLYDMSSLVNEWVEDCWHKNYVGAPTDGAAWETGDCGQRVLRGGAWRNNSNYTRPSNRDRYDATVRYFTHGFRVAQ